MICDHEVNFLSAYFYSNLSVTHPLGSVKWRTHENKLYLNHWTFESMYWLTIHGRAFTNKQTINQQKNIPSLLNWHPLEWTVRIKLVEGILRESEVWGLLANMTHSSFNRHISSTLGQSILSSPEQRPISILTSRTASWSLTWILQILDIVVSFYFYGVAWWSTLCHSANVWSLYIVTRTKSWHDLNSILLPFYWVLIVPFSHTLRNSMNICQVELKWWFNFQ